MKTKLSLLAWVLIALSAWPVDAQPPRPRPRPVESQPVIAATPVPFEPVPGPQQLKLREHFRVLSALGVAEIDGLGTLNLPSGPLGAPTGLLRPKPAILGPALLLTARRVMVSPGNRWFEPFSAQGGVLLTEASAEAALATGGRGRLAAPSAVTTTQETVPLNTAYWVANQISIPDDTTIVLVAGNRKLVVIANQIKVGTNVTFTYERLTSGTAPSTPPKPGTPNDPGVPPPFSVGYAGGAGSPGASGGPGLSYNADPNGAAPQVEIWTLDLQGSPAFDLKGQDGGQGGHGGDGGDGGRGGRGSDSDCLDIIIGWDCQSGPGSGGNGGPGGRAGDGGPGGQGGPGGRFFLYAPQASISTYQAGFFMTVDGGAAGPGGVPGTPGAGGAGGAVGRVLCNVCNKPAADRVSGQPGAQGGSGQQGVPGQPGLVQQPDPIQFVAITSSIFNAELTRPAIDHFASSTSPQGKAVQGEAVSAHGLRFTDTDTVLFSDPSGAGVPVTTSFLSDTLLRFQVPLVVGGFRSIQVRRANGQLSNLATLYILPTLAATVPGPRVTPGDVIQIMGTGFAPGARVRIDNLDVGEATYGGPSGLSIQLIRPATLPTKQLTADGGESVQLTVALADGTLTSPLSIVLDTYRIFVSGDSMMWGTGLPEPQKFHSLTEAHLRMNQPGNRRVVKAVAAHTGARIGLTPFDSTSLPAIPGEVPTRYPTVFHQAAVFFGHPEAPFVDLILVDGCANDVGILNWMDPTRETSWIEQSVTYHCYNGMLQLLDRLAAEFLTAKIIVTGHYAPVGPNTTAARLVGLLTALDKELFDVPGYIVAGVLQPGAKQRIVDNCETFASTSNAELTHAVNDANAKLPSPRIAFADPGFEPGQHAAMSGPSSLIFGVQENGDPEDPAVIAEARKAACKAHKDRVDDMAMCVRASAGHPNQKGAQRYFQAILPFL